MRTVMLVAFFVCAMMTNGLAGEPHAGSAQDARPEAATQANEQVAKIVDAFSGEWKIDGTVALPGLETPAVLKWMMSCKEAALNKAVACSGGGEIVGVGENGFACVIGYNPEEQVVHFMIITSDGEYHDHVGTWTSDDDLVFEPLTYTTRGQTMVENFAIHLAGKKGMSFESTTSAPDGAKIVMKASGKRRQ